MTSLLALRFRLIVLAASLMLCGCGSLLKPETWSGLLSSEPKLREVSIISGAELNDGYPVALDIVFVQDAALLTTIASLGAAEWFLGREDFRRQHQAKLAVASWEVVPGQRFEKVHLPKEAKQALGVLVFADYPGAKSFRASIRAQNKVLIHLRRDDFEVSPK